MSDRYSMSDPYTLHDGKYFKNYITGVSLADCTIPFVELLNRADGYTEFYKKEWEKANEENRKLLKKIEDMEYLMKRFEFLYDETVEEMVEHYED